MEQVSRFMQITKLSQYLAELQILFLTAIGMLQNDLN